MALLYEHGDIGASAARAALDLTPGNLDAHARRLEEAGFAASRKALLRGGFEARFRITDEGRVAFAAYLTWLEEFVRVVKGPRGPA